MKERGEGAVKSGCKTVQSDADAAWGRHVTQYAKSYVDFRQDCTPGQFDDEFEGGMELCKRSVVTNENNSRNKNSSASVRSMTMEPVNALPLQKK